MKKNILLIAHDFAPENNALAVRPTKLAKYLTRSGYEVTVLTAAPSTAKDELLAADLSECGRVLSVCPVQALSVFSHLMHRPIRAARPSGKSAGESVSPESVQRAPAEPGGRRFVDYLRARRREKTFYRAALDYVQHAGLDLSHFDLMLSVSSPMSTHLVALALKAKCPTLKWIADYRDPVEWTRGGALYRYYKKWQSRIMEHCDLVTAASEGILKQLVGTLPNKKACCIYNGYDTDELRPRPKEETIDQKTPFVILASGVIHPSRGDLSVVFSALEDLLKSGRVRRDQIRVDYYGSEATAARLSEVLSGMDLPPLFSYCGRASRSEVHSAMSRSQMLFCGTAQEGVCGIIPVRFPELLLLKKPILGVVEGTGQNSEFANLIRALRVGVCYESGGGEESYEALKKYIAESYTYWRTRERELYEADEKKHRSFDYSTLIRRWIDAIEEC